MPQIRIGVESTTETSPKKEHIWRFNKLYEDIKQMRLDINFVAELEWKDNIFPNVDYKGHL